MDRLRKKPAPLLKSQPAFTHRSYYINLLEHVQNNWNVNLIYPEAPNQWTTSGWRAFLTMIKAFGYTCFEYSLPPSLFDRPALQGGGKYARFSRTMNEVTGMAHELGLKTVCQFCCNAVGPRWHYLCPNIPKDREEIRMLYRHWMRELKGTDIAYIHPGDIGGCNLNGCTHETFVDLSLEITEIIKRESPSTCVQVGTWGNPFCGWGSDADNLPGWDCSWLTLIEQGYYEKYGNRDFHGTPERAKAAMEYFINRLPQFPEDTMVAINWHFNDGGDAKVYVREIAKIRSIVSWQYYATEGEGWVHPCWRLPIIAYVRQRDRKSGPYIGGLCYTMSPRLNLLNMYAGARYFIDPDADPVAISCEFCGHVFGKEYAIIGELFKAFEQPPDLVYDKEKPLNDKMAWRAKFKQMIDCLQNAHTSQCDLPLIVDPETYRKDLLWFAQRYYEMTGSNPDRKRIQREYWTKTYAIYDKIPYSALVPNMGNVNAISAAKKFSELFTDC